MTKDFPAAHSMDTTWFGIDGEGHLASFESGEAGCVPTEFDREQETIFDRITRIPPGNGVEFFVDDLVDKPDGKVLRRAHEGWRETELQSENYFYSVLVWLKKEPTHAERAAAGSRLSQWFQTHVRRKQQDSFYRLPVEPYLFMYADAPSRAELGELFEMGIVNRMWITFYLEPWRFGIFEYEHGEYFENWISGPYVKDNEPKKPLKLEHLPVTYQLSMKAFRLAEAQFERDNAVDPREFGECSDWGSQSVTIDGKVKGNEE